MGNNKIQLSNVIIDKIQTLKDGGLKITLVTRELPTEEEFALFKYRKEEVAFVLDEPVVEKDEKSPSKRLKDRMYVYYNWKNNTDDGFNAWYINSMDNIGKTYLKKVQDN